MIQIYSDFKKSILFTDVFEMICYQNSCELVRLECIVCKDEKEEKEVLINLVSTMANWFIEASEYIYTQDELILKEIKKWEV